MLSHLLSRWFSTILLRQTGVEPATVRLVTWCSTCWATSIDIAFRPRSRNTTNQLHILQGIIEPPVQYRPNAFFKFLLSSVSFESWFVFFSMLAVIDFYDEPLWNGSERLLPSVAAWKKLHFRSNKLRFLGRLSLPGENDCRTFRNLSFILIMLEWKMPFIENGSHVFDRIAGGRSNLEVGDW